MHKYSYKAYYSGLGMSGLGDLVSNSPIVYFALPKELTFVSICADKSIPDNVPIMRKAKFMRVAMIPVYELIDIE